MADSGAGAGAGAGRAPSGAAGAAEDPWAPLKRDYDAEVSKLTLSRSVAADHPLTARRLRAFGAPVTSADGGAGSAGAGAGEAAPDVTEMEDGEVDFDPLSAMAMMDPLSAMAAGGAGSGAGAGSAFSFKSRKERKGEQSRKDSAVLRDARQQEEDERAAEWANHKEAIMRAHTVSGKIKVTAAFLSDVSNKEDNQAMPLDKARARLEALEKQEEADSVELTNQEILASVTKHRRDLEVAWKRAERVRSLKIAIQCAKLLLEMSVPQFYPSIFVHVTDVLDTFGNLVYRRIFKRAEEALKKMDGPGKRLSESFTAADISSDAKETCRNWIYKTACIRELLPRLFVEMALLKCYRFLADDDFPSIVARLFNSIRGIGDVMVAAFARTYLTKCAAEVLNTTQTREKVLTGLHDFMFTFQELKGDRRQLQLTAQGLTMPVYVSLMSQAVLWQVQAVAKDSTKEAFTSLLAKYRRHCNDTMVLKHILNSFSAKLYAQHARSMVALINEAEATLVPKASCFQALAAALSENPPPKDQRLPLLNDAWRVVTHVEDPRVYSNCVAAFISLLLKHYEEREILILLHDCSRHMQAAAAADTSPPGGDDDGEGEGEGDDDGADESKGDADGATPAAGPAAAVERARVLPAKARSGMAKVMALLLDSDKINFGMVFTSDPFVQLLDLFPPKKKAALSKRLLETFTRSQKPTNDPVVIHMLFDVARTLHDSLDSLSVDDERRQIARLICKFIDKIDFGRDLEQQLNTLVDCRAVFANLDSVKDRLVLAVSQLAMRAYQFMKGRHTRKTSAFVKGCFAYCHITIPSIDSIMSRLNLFLVCGQTALINQCLPQADTFFKAAIQDVVELGQSLDGEASQSVQDQLIAFLTKFVAAMVVVPGHPDLGPFYLSLGLINALERFPWISGTIGKSAIYLAMLSLFAAYGQEKLPYRVKGVESNDVLYTGDPTYTAELHAVTGSVIEHIMTHLTELGTNGSVTAKNTQTAIIVQLLEHIVTSLKVEGAHGTLVVNLFRLAHKNDPSNAGLKSVRELVLRRAAAAEEGVGLSTWASLKPLATALTASA